MSSARLGTQDAWLEWIAQQGEMGARVAAFDWSTTSLGPLREWPTPVRSALMLCLGSLFPVALRLGDDMLVIYNDACRQTYAQRFEHALGRPHREVWPETTPQLGAILESVLTTGKPYFASDRAVYLDRSVPGEECYFTFSYNAILGDDGAILGLMSTFVETTERVLAERRLHTLARLASTTASDTTPAELAGLALTALAENAADHPSGGIFRGEADEPVLLASFGDDFDEPAARKLARRTLAGGANQQSAGGLHAIALLDHDRPSVAQVLVLAEHPQRPCDQEWRNYLSLLEATLTAAMLNQAKLSTERGQIERMQALDEAKSAFFAGLSHELRTPLTLIAAPIEEALAERAGLGSRARADLELVQGNVERLIRLVDAMLDFSRMEAGRVAPALHPIDVAETLHGLAVAFEPAMRSAGLDFVIETPPLSRHALVDDDFLERIVLNLLSNAVKFTPAGSVRLSLAETANGYVIEVSDTGVGIAEDDQRRIFDRFQRLETPTGARAATGAGIGLAMVRQLAELIGGSVTLRSAPGVGSSFTVTLPFEPQLTPGLNGSSITPRRVESFLVELESWVHPTQAKRPDGNRPELLVVEDDAPLANYLADALAGSYRVEVAKDGDAALTSLRRHRPDIMLSDLSMPGLDGLALVAAVRDDPTLRELPVVLLSGRADQDSAVLGLGEGADDYIAKPFSMVDLRARLAANLHRARERSVDSAWRRAVLSAIHDGVVIFDSEGLVLELNQAFTDLLGYDLSAGPIRPPYPWWPTEDEDAAALTDILRGHQSALRGDDPSGEYLFYSSDRRPVWVASNGAQILHRESGMTASVRVVRDITREKAARERRLAAAQVTADFGSIDDLDTLLSVAEHGFTMLFAGGSTIELSLDGRRHLLASGGIAVSADDLPEQVRIGLAGKPSADTTSRRPGILLVPRSSESGCRAWIQFPAPRRIGPDEMIVADLLAQAFALAVDRVIRTQRAADREANLSQAMESHRLIGQAIGILVERHRILPAAAFDRLKSASQHRNLKLREVARRVIESGLEPEEA